jgi:hypothetical protein
VLRSHALFSRLFDYAGLLPPASLDIDTALEQYARHRASVHGWMLGRFLVPTSLLDACSAAATRHLPTGEGARSWRFSALAGHDLQADAAQVSTFNGRHADAACGAALVDTVELKVLGPEDVRAARVWASRGFDVYCEVPLGPDMERVLDAVARAGLHATLRAGGVDGVAQPTFDEVAAFLCGCVARGVVAKATAGPHPVVTGTSARAGGHDAPEAPALGYLNLILAAGIAEGAGRAAAQSADVASTVAHLLSLRSSPRWVGHAAIEWQGEHGPIIEGPLDHFAVAGRALIRSIGTHTFEAPVEDARRIGLVP